VAALSKILAYPIEGLGYRFIKLGHQLKEATSPQAKGQASAFAT
jgi:hypothetical protein